MADIVNRSDRLLVFDGDDTLWETQALYTAAKTRIFEYLRNLYGGPARIAEYFEAEDLANVSRHGFTLRRFELSIRNTIDAFTPKGLENSRDVNALVASVLESIKEGPTPLVSGAIRLLEDLEPVYRLVLMTKGDPTLQEHRIADSGLGHLFEQVYIVDEKTPQSFQKVLADTGASVDDSWSIGNSLRSDIRPAVMIGMKGIWIEKATWAWEDAANDEGQSIVKVRRLEDVRSLLIPVRG